MIIKTCAQDVFSGTPSRTLLRGLLKKAPKNPENF